MISDGPAMGPFSNVANVLSGQCTLHGVMTERTRSVTVALEYCVKVGGKRLECLERHVDSVGGSSGVQQGFSDISARCERNGLIVGTF